jgi:hypothetical protein
VTIALDRLLAQWETDPSLFEPQHLRKRFEVLDQLDASFGPADSPPTLCGLPEASLRARAASLRSRCESANAAACAAIRAQIQQGTRPVELPDCLRPAARPSPSPGLGYDYLDELVAGILQLPPPEETHRVPEPEMVFYQPTPVRHILHLLEMAALSPSDIFIDIGSGLGHVPLLVAILAGVPTVGVELDASLVRSARGCVRALGLHHVAFMQADARAADLSRGTVFYLYTPFSGELLRSVIARLRHEASLRPIRVATLGPCTNVLAREPWLNAQAAPDPDRITLFLSSTRK